MLNKRNRNKLHNYNKTHIDIHNYNKFLYDLDNKSIIHLQNYNPKIHNDTHTLKQTEIFDNIQYVIIDDVEITNVNDLLMLIDKYPLHHNIQYNINIKALHKIKEPLIQLNNMIGLNHIKENIVEQILYYIQDLQTSNIDFMHCVIYGSPGTGKTEIAKIIGSIFSKLGILTKGTFKKVTRSDLVAGYLGQTALKTRDVIKESLGGVLFIDEAYSLGNYDKVDSFSKECVDTLCESLSDHKDNLMVIIAGYENELNNCFFTINQGLQSRFTWRFYIDEYSGTDLYNIFLKKVLDCGWNVDKTVEVKWFENKKPQFKFYGRDIETLLTKVKIAHSRRIFCKNNIEKKCITLQDLDKGFEVYMKNNNNKNNDKYNKLISTLYT
jgi:SpoVK/Ycf46/Vps4 family AAA+-type ATPase